MLHHDRAVALLCESVLHAVCGFVVLCAQYFKQQRWRFHFSVHQASTSAIIGPINAMHTIHKKTTRTHPETQQAPVAAQRSWRKQPRVISTCYSMTLRSPCTDGSTAVVQAVLYISNVDDMDAHTHSERKGREVRCLCCDCAAVHICQPLCYRWGRASRYLCVLHPNIHASARAHTHTHTGTEAHYEVNSSCSWCAAELERPHFTSKYICTVPVFFKVYDGILLYRAKPQ